MWKKILISLALTITILSALYWLKTKHNQNIQSNTNNQTVESVFEDQIYTYNANAIKEGCDLNSEMACAVDYTIKCTLNPNFVGCRQAKLPKFIFMEDENLSRPTEMTFKIVKIKPINADLVELHTDSTCNGNWFGLCQGRVIYVLVPSGNSWRVKDIYAIEK